MAKAYNRKVRPKAFNEGDLVLKKILLILGEDQNKWISNYEGLYVVKKTFSKEGLILTKMVGDDLTKPVNFDVVRKYYA
jgi:hypothetical protein